MTLMEGLTVLSTDTTATDAPGLMIVLGILCMLVGIAMLVLSIMIMIEGDPVGVLGIIIALLMFVLGTGLFCEAFNPGQTIYKVIIDESVSIVEFNKRYEILDQDGLIYEIIEREK